MMMNKDVYKKAIERYNGKCALCGKPYEHLHHVFEGRNRSNSTKYGMVVPLCSNCHNYIHNTNYDGFKKQYQREFELSHTREEFLDIFRRNYL